MTWTVDRNYVVSESSYFLNSMRWLWRMKNLLLACPVPWTLRGYGDGASTYVKDPTTDPWANFASISSGGAWLLFQNASGLQLILGQSGSSHVYMRWSVNGDYTAEGPGPWDDAGHNTPPGNTSPPADQVSFGTQNYGYDHIMTTAVSDDGNNIIHAGMTFNSDVRYATILCKLEETKPGDTHPWWSYHDYKTTQWNTSRFQGTGPLGYHPTGGSINYRVSNFTVSGTTELAANPYVDPFTGNHQLQELLVGHNSAPYRHIRGKLPGIYRVPNAHSVGTTYNNGDFMCMGNYCMPWNSSSEALII